MANRNLIALGLAALGVAILVAFYVFTLPGDDPVVADDDPPATEETTPPSEDVAVVPPADEMGEDGVPAIPGDAPGPFLTITVDGQLGQGEITIDLAAELAPNHAAQLTALAREGFYDNVYFHRVIDGFMAQTGDGVHGKALVEWNPRGMGRAGTGGSELGDLEAEFSEVPFVRGIVGMARSQSPNSANSQFFIMFDDGPFLNGEYTVVGRVTAGLDVLDRIKRGDSSTMQVTGEPDRMVTVVATE